MEISVSFLHAIDKRTHISDKPLDFFKALSEDDALCVCGMSVTNREHREYIFLRVFPESSANLIMKKGYFLEVFENKDVLMKKLGHKGAFEDLFIDVRTRSMLRLHPKYLWKFITILREEVLNKEIAAYTEGKL